MWSPSQALAADEGCRPWRPSKMQCFVRPPPLRRTFPEVSWPPGPAASCQRAVRNPGRPPGPARVPCAQGERSSSWRGLPRSPNRARPSLARRRPMPLISVTIPPGYAAGDLLTLDVEGGQLEIEIPQGNAAGDNLAAVLGTRRVRRPSNTTCRRPRARAAAANALPCARAESRGAGSSAREALAFLTWP